MININTKVGSTPANLFLANNTESVMSLAAPTGLDNGKFGVTTDTNKILVKAYDGTTVRLASEASMASTVALAHARQHDISSTADHTSSLTTNIIPRMGAVGNLFLDSSITDDGETVTTIRPIVAPSIKITGGAATGKVLTSGSDGTATWQTSSGGSGYPRLSTTARLALTGMSDGDQCYDLTVKKMYYWDAGISMWTLGNGNIDEGTFLSTGTGSSQTVSVPGLTVCGGIPLGGIVITILYPGAFDSSPDQVIPPNIVNNGSFDITISGETVELCRWEWVRP